MKYSVCAYLAYKQLKETIQGNRYSKGDKWRWQEKDMTGQLVEKEVGEWSQEVDVKEWLEGKIMRGGRGRKT